MNSPQTLKLEFRQIIALLILASFLMMVLYNFTIMAHGQNERMSGSCPFSIPGTSLCPPNAQTAALHHIYAFRSFFNVPINFGVTLSIIFLFFIAYASFALFVSLPTLAPLARKNHFYNFSCLVPYDRKAACWLSFKVSVFSKA